MMTKRRTVYLSFLVLWLCFLSCYEKKTKETQLINKTNPKHEIIGKVIDTISLYISPRTLSPITAKWKFTKEDSIEARKKMLEFINKKRTLAIDTNLTILIPNFGKSKKTVLSEDYFNGDLSFDSLNTITINVNNIKLKKNSNSFYFDSIVYFKPSIHLTKFKTYNEIDYKLNFSNIIYNSDKSEAVIACIYWYKERYPASAMFLLEKQNDNWEIIKSKFFFGY